MQDQYEFRCENLRQAMEESGISMAEMIAIGARGGALIPIYEDGTFLVDDYMCQAFIDSPVEHAANLGAQIAKHFADQEGIRAYNFAKGIGALAAAAGGKVDAIGITGGLAYSKMLMDWVKEYVSFIAPVYIYPGECEVEAIFLGMRRVERGEEEYKIYRKKRRPPIWEQPVE